MNKARILVIDDDPVLRRSLTDILKVKGYEVLAARDGAEGLALLGASAVHLVFIDLGLPDVPGLDVLKRVRADYPATAAIILTGNATLESALMATDMGAFSYLAKPYEIDQLLLQARRAIEKQQAQAALRQSEERFRKIFELGPLGMGIVGLDYRFIQVNRMLCEMVGYPEEELVALKVTDITHPEDVDHDVRNAQRLLRGELSHSQREKRYLRKDGGDLWVHLTVSLFRDDGGAPLYFLWMVEDVTERKRYEARLEYQANHDGLTGLPNRTLLADRIEQALRSARRYRRQVAVLFVDLDQFKFINDSLGHDLGDRLLKIVAERLRGCVRSNDTVARQGGDDFVVVLSDLAGDEDAATVAQQIQLAVNRPLDIDEHELEVSCSIGISIYPKDGEDVRALLKNADVAMYRAKEQGRNNFKFYTGELNDKAVARMTMEKHLRRALEREEFLLHYQPQVDLRTGRITGMEALLRWQSPELGLVSPAGFIPLAEETGLIVPIGEWVMKTACAQNRAWQAAGLSPLTMAVNLSPRQFRQEGLAETVARILRETGLEPRYLELEIVESLIMHDVQSATLILKKLKELGVQLTMDDFGTGYSSLSYLKQFPFDKMKIDQSFVREITSDPDSATIVRTIIAMAHSLNLRAVAEGVETEGQLSYLRSHGCEEMQGFYFSRPVPSGAFEQLLREGRRLAFSGERGLPPERSLLLVDDESQVAAVLVRMLESEGYHILAANSAAEGFELLAANRVGVIVADQRMPAMTGVEFLSRVRELYPETVRILLSGQADMSCLTDAINSGAIFKFLTKPLENEELREHIRGSFKQYELACAKG